MKCLFPILFCAALLGGCGDSGKASVSTVAQPPAEQTEKTQPSHAQSRVGLVMKTLTNPFFIAMERGARRAEKALNVELLVKTAAQETSIEQQIQIVEDMIADGVNAIVIAPGDSQRLIPVIKKAIDRGIKVVNIDNRLDPVAVEAAGLNPIPFVSVDNERAAHAAASYLINDVSSPVKAAIIEGIRTADNARQRMEGAKRAFADNPLVSVVASESANWKIDEGHDIAEKIFAAHPEVSVVFAANDMMGLGVIKFLREAGRTDVRVGAYDALDEAVAEVKSGRLVVTVDQQASEQGFQGVALALRLLSGEQVPATLLIDTRLVTKETLKHN